MACVNAVGEPCFLDSQRQNQKFNTAESPYILSYDTCEKVRYLYFVILFLLNPMNDVVNIDTIRRFG